MNSLNTSTLRGVLFDVDGTLIDSSTHKVSKSTQLAKKKLHDSGKDVIISSGRNHFALGYQLENLNPDYIIACCGAMVFDYKQNRALTNRSISKSDVNTLINFSNEYDAPLLFKFDDAIYFYHGWDRIAWVTEEFKKSIDNNILKFGITNRHLIGSLPLAAMLYTDELHKNKLETITNLHFVYAGDNGYNIGNNGISKATGAKDLFTNLNTKESDYLVFGDNFNDIEIFEYMSYGIAMGNAVNELKNISYHVTDDVSNDGIYNALTKFNLI